MVLLGMVVCLAVPAGRSAAAPSGGGTYFDDDGSVHEPAIEAIGQAGITRGCGVDVDDLFCPSEVVTRGQMAAFLRRALSLPLTDADVFRDDDGSVFEGDIEALASAGIARGCGADRFCPDDPVLRSQMAAFLVRAFGHPASDADVFVDDDGSVFEGDIQALAAAGLTAGCAEGRFCPSRPVTRAETASLLVRALDLPVHVVPPRPVVSLAFTGDTLIHMPVNDRARRNGAGTGRRFDFTPMLAPVRPLLEAADVAICHLEVPLSPASRDLSGYPRFHAPAELADDLVTAGFDGCSTASNHSLDRGAAGVANTLDVLDHAGLAHAGTARSAEEAGLPAVYAVGDVTIAHLSATWSLNGLVEPEGMDWLVQDLDVDRLIDSARAAKEEGADFVVVSVHCCLEYDWRPTDLQRRVDRALLDSPYVDLVVGHHAHVVQPIERRRDEYVVYGLGNFLSAQRRRPETIDGVVVVAEVAARGGRWVTRSLRFAPTWVEGSSYRVLPAAEAARSGGSPHLEAALRESWRRTVRTMLAYDPTGVSPLARP